MNTFQSQDTLNQVADKLVSSVFEIMRTVNTEEDLRIGFEKILSPLLQVLKIDSKPKYEKSILGGRSDALHGQVIIEYESPSSFLSKSKVQHTFEQLVTYIQGESLNKKETLFIMPIELTHIA